MEDVGASSTFIIIEFYTLRSSTLDTNEEGKKTDGDHRKPLNDVKVYEHGK